MQHFVWPGFTFSWQAQYFRQIEWKLKDRITPLINFFQWSPSRCEIEMGKAGRKGDGARQVGWKSCVCVTVLRVCVCKFVYVKVLRVKELYVTKLCVKVCVWKRCHVTKLCVKELCVTELCVKEFCVCDKVVCERLVCERLVCQSCVWNESVTKLWRVLCTTRASPVP